MGRTQVFEWFCPSKTGKFLLNTASFQVVFPHVERGENVEKDLKTLQRTPKK